MWRFRKSAPNHKIERGKRIKGIRKNPNSLSGLTWCRRGDSNPHGFPHHPLKMACLPGSTTSAREEIHLIHGAAERQAESKSAESKSAIQGGCFGEADCESPSLAGKNPPDILAACEETSCASAEPRVFPVNRPRPAFRAGFPSHRTSPGSGPPPR